MIDKVYSICMGRNGQCEDNAYEDGEREQDHVYGANGKRQ